MDQTTTTNRYRAIFISDVHLGTRGCQAERLLDFLRVHEATYLYLVGDIFDFAFKGNRRNIALLHRELGIAKADPLSDRVPDRLSPAMRSTGEGRSGRRG